MNCASVRRQLNRYLDSELEPGAREEVAQHLSACPGCREALRQLEGVAGLLSALKTPPVPEGFAGRLMREARRRADSRPRRGWWRSWPAWWWEQSLGMRAAAGSAIAAGLAVGVVTGSGLSWQPAPSAAPHLASGSDSMAQNLAYLGGVPAGSVEQAYLGLVSQAGQAARR